MIVEILPPNHWWARTHYKLFEDMRFLEHTIPKGFVSDGATTPRILWALFPPVTDYVKAAFLHDYLLKEGHRDYAHDEFYNALKFLNIGPTRSWIMYRSTQIYWDVKRFLFN